MAQRPGHEAYAAAADSVIARGRFICREHAYRT
jgi:hypothetical protein